MKCLKCGHVSAVPQKFCGECGARLVSLEAKPPPFAERSYTPPHLAEKILRTRTALEGERKRVTVLFCDIANSTPLAERIGPDRMHKVLNAFFEAALAEVHRYEGTVNQFLGDGFMALFGAPVSHEDHARRAALSALAIRKAIASDPQFQAPDISLKTRIGLNTGAVVVGRIGDNLRMDYTAIGDTTNVAARIQGLAEPDSILASDKVVRITRDHVESKPLGLRTLKGKSEPIALHELIREHSHRARPGAHADAALVGRRDELEAINQSLERLQAGEGGVLAIVGEAGLGKSRLIEEAIRRAGEHDLRALKGNCLSFGRTLSYWSFREVIRAAFDIGGADSESASWNKLETGMTRLFAQGAEDLLPYIGTLLALTLPEPLAQRVRSLDGLSMGHQIFRSTLLLFERLARERPTIFVLEDWHWADASSAELLEHLLPLADRAPLVFVVASRPEPQGAAASLNKALTGGERVVQRARILALGPLPIAQSAELAERLLGGGLPAEVRDMLLRRSGGNPFYLGELVRALIATHGIERDTRSGEWRVTEQYGAVPLPDTIEGVILARIDQLEDEVKQVLKAAAVVGRSFFYRVLKAVTDSGAALDDDLIKLRRAELIDEKQLAPELEYIFKHPLIQQATYDSIVEDRRRELHREVGRCIEELFASRLEPFYSMLAYHFVKAEDSAKGREYLLKAADHADRLAADEEALELYNAVIADAERSPVRRLSNIERAELDMKIGDAHFRAGRLQMARLALEGALRRLGTLLPRSRLRLGLAVAVGLVPHLLRRFRLEEARLGKQTMEPGHALRCQIWVSMAWIDFLIDPLASLYDSLQMSRLAWDHPSNSWHIIGLSYIGICLDAMGFYRAAGRIHARSRDLAARYGDSNARGIADHSEGLHHHVTGDWATAVTRGESAAAELRGTAGNTRLCGAAMTSTAMYLYSMGEPRWMDLADKISKMAAETNDRQAQAWSLTAAGIVKSHRGEYEASFATSEKAADYYRNIPDPRSLAYALGWQSASLRHLDRISEAVERSEEALRLIERHHLTGSSVTVPLLSAAEVRLTQFESDKAQHSSEARKLASRAVKAMLRQGRRVRDEGAVESQRVAGTFEWLCGDSKGAHAYWSRGLDEARLLGARHAEARIFFERGRRTAVVEDLQQAVHLFGQCRALGELRLADALVGNLPRAPVPSTAASE